MSSHEQVIRRAWSEHVLLSVMLELTYRCNLDCVFCYNDLGSRGEPLSLARYEELVDELADMQVLHLILTGGEPLANPDFFAIGRRARERGFCVRVKSNGHALRGALARRLRDEVDPFVVDLSLHGAQPDTHDRQTRVSGSFDRLMSNIPELIDLGVRLKLNATLTRWNEDEAEGMFAIADRFGLPLQVNPVVSPRDDGDREPLGLSPTAEGRRRFDALVERRYEERLASGAVAHMEVGGPVDEDLAPARNGYNCGAGTGSVTVDPYGNVIPCVQWRRPIGNLHRQSIGEIWSGSTELSSVRRINTAAAGRAAEHGVTSWCMGLSELATGDPLAAVPTAGDVAPTVVEQGRRRVALPIIR